MTNKAKEFLMKKILISASLAAALIGGSQAMLHQNASADAGAGNLYKASSTFATTETRADATGGMWTKPYGQEHAQYVGSVQELKNKLLHVQSKYVDTGNGTTWVKITADSINNNEPFWVDINTTWANQSESTFTNYYYKDMTINPKSSTDSFLTRPWGEYGAKIIANLNDYKGQKIRSTTVLTDQHGTRWAKVTLGKTTGYINATALDGIDDRPFNETNMTTLKHNASTTIVNQESRQDLIWSVPYGFTGAVQKGHVKNLDGQNVKVLNMIKDGQTTWLKIETANNTFAWVDANATDLFATHDKLVEATSQHKTTILKQATGLVWTKPYGMSQAQSIANVADLQGQDVQVSTVANYGSPKNANAWYKITFAQNGEFKTGYIDIHLTSGLHTASEINDHAKTMDQTVLNRYGNSYANNFSDISAVNMYN